MPSKMTQACSRKPLITEGRVRQLASQISLCGGQSSSGTVLSSITSVTGSILNFGLALYLPEVRMGEAWEISKRNALSKIR
jgi:hypothetical protein